MPSTAINFIRRHRRPLTGTLVGALVAGVAFALPHAAFASGFNDAVMSVLANITYWLISFVANFLVVVINIMVGVAQYSKFLGVDAVEKGWAIVRDVCNMFFIVVLLIISFGTILRLENYRYNKLLARLIVMAFLVNFSKFIAGFFIDFSQVIMLTFVNAWRDIAAGNFTSALGLQDIVSLSRDQNMTGSISNVGPVLTALLLGLFLVTVAAIVMSIITIVLVLRILALWFLIVLSPLAFLLKTYPSTEKYAARWWQEFGKYVVTGPVVAFLLWLTLAIIASPTNVSKEVFTKVKTQESGGVLTTPIAGEDGTVENTPEAKISAAITTIGESEKLLSYLIGIMLLVGTLVITKELGVAGGQMAGQWADKIKGFATKAAVLGGAAVTGAGLAGTQWGGIAGMGAAVGGKRSIQLAGTGLKKGAGFLGRKADELSIRAQTGQGNFGKFMQRFVPKGVREHPISFRPSMIKKGYQDYRRRREEGIYGKVATGGMVDAMNYIMSRGKDKTDFAYQAEMQEVKKKKSERSAGGTRKERLLSDLKTFLDFTRDADGRVTNAQIKAGKEGDVEAIMQLLMPNHDINELVKDQDIRSFLEHQLPDDEDKSKAGEVNVENMQRLLEGLFGDKAGRVAMDLGELGLSNMDPWLYAMTKMNALGKPQLLTAKAMAAEEGKDYRNDLMRWNAKDHGDTTDKDGKKVHFDTWEEYADHEEKMGRGDKLKGDKDTKGFRDIYDEKAAEEQGAVLAAFNAKRENRQIAVRLRRQDLVTEKGMGRGDMTFSRGFHTMGQTLLRDVLSNMSDYGYATGETKQMLQSRVDVIKALADTGVDDSTDEGKEKKAAAIERYKQLTGGQAPTVKINEEQRAGMYRLASFILGKDAKGYSDMAANKTNDEMSGALDQMIGQYHGGAVKDGPDKGISKFAKYELAYNRKVEENRGFFDDPKNSEKQHEEKIATLRTEAAKEAGYGDGVPPKIGPPVNLKEKSTPADQAEGNKPRRTERTAPESRPEPTGEGRDAHEDMPEMGDAGAVPPSMRGTRPTGDVGALHTQMEGLVSAFEANSMQLISALRETSTESSRQIVESIRQIKSSNPSRGAELQGQFDKLQREPDKLTENETERLLKGIRDELKLIKDSAKPSTSTADDEQDPSKD